MAAGLITAVLMVLFLAGWAWAWNPGHQATFDAAARLPLEDGAGSGTTAPTHKESGL